MVILLESSKTTMQVTNHALPLHGEHTATYGSLNLFFSTDKYLFFIHWEFDNFDWDF